MLTALTLTTVYGLLGTGAIRSRARARKRDGLPTVPSTDAELAAFAAPSGIQDMDVGALCRDAMRNAESVAHQQLAKMRIAVVDGMTVRGDPRALRAAMTRLMETATRSSPCGEILVTGASQGGRVQIAVTADATHPATPDQTEDALRPAERIFAMHGGTFQVEHSADRGTRFTVRLLEQAGSGVRDDAARLALLVPASAPASTAVEARSGTPLYVHH